MSVEPSLEYEGDPLYVRKAAIEPEYAGTYSVSILLRVQHGDSRSVTFLTPFRGDTEEECKAFATGRWPSIEFVTPSELRKDFYRTVKGGQQSGTGKRMATSGARGSVAHVAPSRMSGGGNRASVQRPSGSPVLATQKEHRRVVPKADPDELIAPVAYAKEVGIPPQYVYNRISKGALKSVQGTKSKMIRRGDADGQFGIRRES